MEFYEFGEDALLIFTNALLVLLDERSVVTESPFYLPRYTPELADVAPIAVMDFGITRAVPQRLPLWR